jgi:hypothetical protein
MGANAETIKTAIAQGLKSSIPDVPERIKLSELVGKAREAFHKERHEAFYAHYEPSEYGGGWLSLDSDESTSSKYSADMRLSINKNGEVYSLKLDGRDITPKSIPDAAGRFDGLRLRSTLAAALSSLTWTRTKRCECRRAMGLSTAR